MSSRRLVLFEAAEATSILERRASALFELPFWGYHKISGCLEMCLKRWLRSTQFQKNLPRSVSFGASLSHRDCSSKGSTTSKLSDMTAKAFSVFHWHSCTVQYIYILYNYITIHTVYGIYTCIYIYCIYTVHASLCKKIKHFLSSLMKHTHCAARG